ncbi:unnamed protein product, partial [Allacma fusca]
PTLASLCHLPAIKANCEIANQFTEMAFTSVLVNFSTKLMSSDLGLLLILNSILALSASEINLNPVLNSSSTLSRVEKCEHDTLNECWNQLPPFPDQGIPSSDAGVKKACEGGSDDKLIYTIKCESGTCGSSLDQTIPVDLPTTLSSRVSSVMSQLVFGYTPRNRLKFSSSPVKV